ncbi:MAG: hypothetical protein HGA45_26220 [Chloroflexales bacterium]|nr:hypothetical protein [Chloroflexales bacterium]
MGKYGVHSEVGKLRTVIVHRPGVEMQRLTPQNCRELLDCMTCPVWHDPVY